MQSAAEGGLSLTKCPKSMTVVLKLGTSSIVDEDTRQPLLSVLTLIVETAVKLKKEGHRVIIVSSGAIGVGLLRMEMEDRPKHLSALQALAAIGQCRLISLWDDLFGHFSQPVAQVLLTRNDIADRSRYVNAQNTLNELLNFGVIPIVNENDTLAVSEIKFGDNDTLSAITAGMVHADLLFLMTDVDCLYDKNPRSNPEAKAIEVVEDIGTLEADVTTAGSALGTGGMMTKIIAARLATSVGVKTIITRSSNPGNIVKIVQYDHAQRVLTQAASMLEESGVLSENGEHNGDGQINGNANGHTNGNTNGNGEHDHHLGHHHHDPLSYSAGHITLDQLEKPPLHTAFLPDAEPIRDRHFWLLHTIKPTGTIYIDSGAHKALKRKAGLLPAGVVDVDGHFGQQESVRIMVVERLSEPSSSGQLWTGVPDEVGRALVNYAALEVARIKGHQSREIESLIGYSDSDYVAERQHISLFQKESRPATPAPELTIEQADKVMSAIAGITAYEAHN